MMKKKKKKKQKGPQFNKIGTNSSWQNYNLVIIMSLTDAN